MCWVELQVYIMWSGFTVENVVWEYLYHRMPCQHIDRRLSAQHLYKMWWELYGMCWYYYQLYFVWRRFLGSMSQHMWGWVWGRKDNTHTHWRSWHQWSMFTLWWQLFHMCIRARDMHILWSWRGAMSWLLMWYWMCPWKWSDHRWWVFHLWLVMLVMCWWH